LIAAIAEISLTRLAAIANFVGALRPGLAARMLATMANDVRLQIRLPAQRRAALDHLAADAGLSSSALARLAIGQLLESREVVLPKLSEPAA
jgi:hypothetical protein